MAKGAYVGVGGSARKVKKIYVGVDGVARKVKKVFVGVGGVPKLTYSAGINFSGTIPSLSVDMFRGRSSEIGDYVLWVGGKADNRNYNGAYAYNSQLTGTIAPTLTNGGLYYAASNSAYAIYSGRHYYYYSDRESNEAEAYNTSLVKVTSISGLHSPVRYGCTTVSTPTHAYFAGGEYQDSTPHLTKTISVYNTSLVKSNRYLQIAAEAPVASQNSVYVIFAGGDTQEGTHLDYTKYGTAINKSTQATTNITLPSSGGVSSVAMTPINNRALIKLYTTLSSDPVKIQAFDTNLVQTAIVAPSGFAPKYKLGDSFISTRLEWVSGGYVTKIDAFDNNFICTQTFNPLNTRTEFSGGVTGNQLLLLGDEANSASLLVYEA